MTWGLVGMAAVSVAQGVAGANAANTAGKNARVNGLRQEALQWDQNAADNKAIGEANLTNIIRTGYKVGLLNVQRAQAKKRAMQDGITLSRNRLSTIGAATANSAAAGTVGSSVDAVINDIESKVGEAAAQMDADDSQQSDNFDTQLYDILMSGQDHNRAAATTNVNKTPEFKEVGLGSVLINSAAQVGGAYFGAKMSLGLGPTK